MRRSHLTAAALALLSLLPSALWAQGVTTSAVAGRVTDPEGDPVVDATVTVTRVESGFALSAQSRADGRYYIANLRPGGPYRIEVARIGFRGAARDSLRLTLGQILTVDFDVALQAVQVAELEVRVEPSPDFSPSRMGSSTLIDEEAVERLPTLSRNFVEFASLSPLVRASTDGISVAGANLRFNNLQVDGALNQDVFGLSPSGVAGGRANARVVPLDAIQQLQVLVSPYDIRQSGFTGGVLNAVTRSGTNRWTGSVHGFYRSDGLVGNLDIDGGTVEPDPLDDLFLGLTLGGPVVKDRVHLFTAVEIERLRQPPVGFNVGVADPIRTQLAPDSIARMEEILRNYGAEPGESGVYELENKLANVFARVDISLSARHKGMLRYNYAGATDDPTPNRLPGDAYELSSSANLVETDNHSVLAQLLSDLSGSVSNDLLVNLQFSRDTERPNEEYARVEVEIDGEVDGESLSQRVRAGANLFAHANELDQDILEVVDNLTWATGPHRIVFGAAVQRFGIRRLAEPGSLGSYRFASLGDLELDEAEQYDINLPLDPEEDPSVNFSVLQWSAYVQDQWSITDRLNVRFGVRLDVPVMPDAPRFNPAVEEDFGHDTSRMPSGNPLVSPRVGFNARLGRNGNTQLRGGTGLFAGRPPFAWLANAYQGTGLQRVSLTCVGGNAPAFDPTLPSATTCADGSGAEIGTPSVTMFDPDFRFPQDFKASIAIDQRLPLGLVGTIEGVYTRAVHQVFLEDVNIGERVPAEDRIHENGYSDGFGFGSRDSFGTPTVSGFAPNRVSDRFGQAIRVTNSSDNFAYAITAQLTRRFRDRFGIGLGYSYSRSGDTQSLTSLDAVSNYGLTPIEGDPNRPKVQPSLFDRPHKVVATASARFLEHLGGTELTVVYIGQSGQPYSYVYIGDVNGDGYAGDGRALDLNNDLIYVSEAPFDFPDGISAFLFEGLTRIEPCLNESRVRVLSRNACRSPWTNRLDLRLSQTIRAGGARIQILFDVLNTLNLLNGGWGQVQTVNPVVQLLSVEGRHPETGLFGAVPQDPLFVRYRGPLRRDPATGSIVVARPTVPDITQSLWQAQLGLRVSF